MSLLDDLLRLLGTNRTRVRWRLQQLRKSATQKQRSVANRSQSLSYEHQLCPSCGHPAAKDEKECTRCGAKMRGAAVHKASRALGWLLPEGVPIVTMVYLAACVALYFVTVKATHDYHGGAYEGGFKPDPLQTIRYGANLRPLIEVYGEWWRLVTANFLHGSVMHIAMNAFGLWVAGNVIEERFGAARTAVVLFVTAVAGAALSFVYGSGFSVGASTAGFGAIGFVVGHVIRFRGHTTADLRDRFVPWLIYGLIMSFAIPKIDLWAHLGGLAAGLVLGVLLADKQQARRMPEGLWKLLALACVAACAWAFYEMAVWGRVEEVREWLGA